MKCSPMSINALFNELFIFVKFCFGGIGRSFKRPAKFYLEVRSLFEKAGGKYEGSYLTLIRNGNIIETTHLHWSRFKSFGKAGISMRCHAMPA